MQKITKGLFSTVPVQSVAGLHPFSQCIYMWLCKYSNDDNQCRPSISTLCKNTGISKNSLIKYLNILEKKGFIKKTNRCADGEYTSNMYDVFVLEGSAGDAPPSAGDAPGGSAGDAPPSAGDGNKLNPLTKSTSLTKSKEILSNDNTPDGENGNEYGNKEINGIIEVMKQACTDAGLQYMPGYKERQFAKHILSKKLANEIEKYNMPLHEFIANIIKLSAQPYMKQVNTPQLFYQNRGHIINSGISSTKSSATKISYI